MGRHLYMEAILSRKITLHEVTSTGTIPEASSYGIIMVVLLGQKAIRVITIY